MEVSYGSLPPLVIRGFYPLIAFVERSVDMDRGDMERISITAPESLFQKIYDFADGRFAYGSILGILRPVIGACPSHGWP